MEDQTGNGVTAAASTATERAREIALDAGGSASELAGSVREQASEVGHEVLVQSRQVIDDARDKLKEQADMQSRQAVSALRDWSERGRALAEGRPQDAGPLADYARELSGRVSFTADRFEQRGFDGVVEDVKSFARRRPGIFLVGAGLAGFAVGRLLRGAATAPGSTRSPYGSVGTTPRVSGELAAPPVGMTQTPAAVPVGAYPGEETR